MSEELFVYGTLKLPDVQRQVIGREVELIDDILVGYKTSPVFIDGAEYLTLIPDESSEIAGAILSITRGELARIDEYEPDEYKRITVTSKSGRTTWVYVKADG